MPNFGADRDETFSENTAVGTTLLTFSASDADAAPHGIVRHSIESVTNSGLGLFSIDQTSGKIRLAKTLDYETQTNYKITVIAVDGGTPAQTGTGTITIQVSDVNDVKPTCSPASHVRTEAENSALNTVVIADLGCTDSDTSPLIYTITQSPQDDFSIDTTGATTALKLSTLLDYETNPAYTIEITVSDGDFSTTINVDISVGDVNDGGPSFSTATYTVNIPEDAAIGASVITVTATDPDGDSSKYGNLKYAITGGNTGNKFLIDSDTGLITKAGVLDAEGTSTYTLTVTATEEIHTNSDTATVTITVDGVDDNDPACTSDMAFSSVMAEEGTIGDVLFSFLCSDADGETVTYTITNGDTTYFEIVGSDLKLKSPIDYDTVASSQFDLTIRVSDGTRSVYVTGTVLVTGVNEHSPVFTPNAVYHVSKAESLSPGSVITTVSVADNDVGDSVTYSWVTPPSGFTLDQESGEILLSGRLDRETTASYTLQIKATDGTNAVTGTVSLTVTDVNDNAPAFSPPKYSITVAEGTALGAVITVTAADTDDPGTNDYGTVTYSIIDGNTGSYFSIDSTTGEISTTTMLDYEASTVFTLIVQAADSAGNSGAKSSSAVVTVNIGPVNEFDPVFQSLPYSTSFDENTAVGTTLLTVTASDTDVGDDGDVYYSMAASTMFYLNTENGKISLKNALNYETNIQYTFDVVAHDSGASPRSVTVTVTINVNDVNDNAPVCDPSFLTIGLLENQIIGNIATVSCTDGDTTSPNNDLVYTLVTVNGGPSTIFSMSGTGVMLDSSFDYETETSYDIIIKVEDQGVGTKFTTTVTVRIEIGDVNEHNPEFTNTLSVSISESTAAGTSIFQLLAADSDTSEIITFSSDPAITEFSVDPDTGNIYLVSNIDFDNLGTPNMELEVYAADNGQQGSRTVTSTLTITILDENDVTPVFFPAVYYANVTEPGVTGTSVTTITATDSDSAVVSYSLADVTIFQIDTGGVVRIQNGGLINYETTTSYALVAYAEDDGGHSATTTIHIKVIGINEDPPVFSPATESINIDENINIGFLVVDTTATDGDSGADGKLTYSISSVPSGFDNLMAINPQTGEMTVAGDVDMEVMTINPVTFNIEVTDAGTDPDAKIATFTLYLTINDLNDNSPVCNLNLYSKSVLENASGGDAVVTLGCTDGDATAPNNVITYAFVAGSDGGGNFDLQPSTGAITVTTSHALDRETTDNYLILVDVADGGGLTTTASLTVYISDANDNAPVFTSTSYAFVVAEDHALSTTVGGAVAANDADIDLAGSFAYSIFSGNTGDKFAIDANNGEIKLVGALDHDTIPTYQLVVYAIDRATGTKMTGSATVDITVTDVNDITPYCSPALQTIEVPENTADSVNIGFVACADTDSAMNNQVSYTIVTVNGIATTTPFILDATTGKFDLNTATLDYETTTLMTVVVHAIDNGASPLTGTATLNVVITNVNEHTPAFQNIPYTGTVIETVSTGSSVFVVTATDGDAKDTVTYSLNPASNVFEIDPNTGIIYLSSALDFESTVVYPLTVRATDSGGLFQDAGVTITVTDANDVKPVFNPAVYVAEISENDIVGTSVTTVTATDSDTAAASLTYAIFSGNDDGVFVIETLGRIFIQDTTNLDYDSATKSYSLVITCTDGTHTASTTVAIAVANYNDNTPTFGADTSSTQNIPENSATGYSIVTVLATDADHSGDGSIAYSITAGNSDGLFSINPNTGQVTLVGQLDAEGTSTYSVTITATDGGTNPSALTADYALTVIVIDSNDIRPICSHSLYSMTVEENVGIGTPVGQVTCTDGDKDSPNNQIANYVISNGVTGGDLTMSASGEISTVNLLDRENTRSYSLIVHVIDNGATPLTGTTTVTVIVNDVNDNEPFFTSNPYHESISESTAVGSSVFAVAASDLDQGTDATFTYQITTGNADNKFAIDSSTGDITLVDDLDFESLTPAVYSLEVIAIDNDVSSPKTGTTTLSMTILDANDNFPSCSPMLTSLSFPEDTAGGSNIANLACTDTDSGVNGDLAYAIVSVNGDTTSTLFQTDNSGGITTSGSTILDYESATKSYRILIRVKDNGTPALSSTATVNVDITDVNEADPAFTSTPYTHNVAETTTVGTSVYKVTATDADTSEIISYSINPSSSHFEIDPSSGNIYTIAKIDFDTLVSTTITLTVIATDSGSPARTVTESVTFTIINANDGIPVFNPGVYTATLQENTAPTYTVLQVTVTDIDDTSFTYAIITGNDDNVFSMDANGNLLLSDIANFDYDTQAQSYLLVVQAQDSSTNTATASVAIEVTSWNEFSPVLTTIANTLTFSEDTSIGTSVDTVVASDADSGSDGEITYTISSVSNSGDGKFTVDPTSGLVTLSGSLDRESQSEYEITILAADGGINPSALTSTYSLTVSVLDVNDVTPSCTQTVYIATASEDLTVSSPVVQLTCSDGDATAANNVVNTYTITSGNIDTAFSISNTGEVQIGSVLDRETLGKYKLLVEVADSGTPALTTTATVSIVVNDVNDNTPVFASIPYVVTQVEDISVGTVVETVQATDGDTGDAAKLVYSIISGDVDSKFSIDPSNGDIILTDDLDFETVSVNPYELIIHAVDSDPNTQLTGITTVRITVDDTNDNDPVCTMLQTLILSEMTQTGTTTLLNIGTTCSDADTGVNAQLSYAIYSVNGAVVLPTDPFSIDAGSGAIRLSNLMDYEVIQAYTVLVEVSDGGTPVNTVTVTVEVDVTDGNDNLPTFTGTPYSTNVIESTAVGSTIFTVAATDDDTEDTITFTINPAMTEFGIDPHTGKIILLKELDYDNVPTSYEITVVATDDGTVPGPSSSSATVTITVTDFNDGTPEFHPGVYSVSVSENEANGYTVTTLTITDIDTVAFGYNIESGNSLNVFNVSGIGKTPVVAIIDNTLLDYETVKDVSLVISVTDGANTASCTVEVTITPYNEDTPVFTGGLSTGTASVAENSITGTQVYDIDATDGDDGEDGEITYSIVSGAAGKFSIDPTTGIITVAGALDTETTPTYTLVIEAKDKGITPSALSAQFTLTITVTDVNDNTPYCSSTLYSASIAESVAVNSFVAQLTCLDADTDAPNNLVTSYVIQIGQSGGEFLISNTGEVTTTVSFDREIGPDNYQLEIVVTDSGTSPSALSTTTTLTITITDVNDNDPAFSLAIYNLNVAENTVQYTSIGTVTATDQDIGLAATLTFSIFSGNGDGKFAIDYSSGDIQLVDSLDYETESTYTLGVYAVDRLAPFRTGTATVSVTVTDVNDVVPVCTASLYTGTVAEDAVITFSVAKVDCSDGDSTVGNTINYSITSILTEFVVDANSGDVTVNGALDMETTESYDVIVQASDGTFTTNATVKISVTNINDKTPQFNPSGPYTTTITENLAIGNTVFDLDATDADITDTTFVYRITNGNADGKFTIGTTSGIIQTTKTIDRDDPITASYTLTIEVADGSGIGALTATSSIVISVTDENDNWPRCDASVYTATASEDASIGLNLVSPTCTDLDVVASSTLVYSINSGNGENKFQINGGTGVISLQASLDYETTSTYTLVVLVDDQGTPSAKTTTLTMVIYVDPVNEHTPAFTGEPYDVSVDENKANEYLIVIIAATDEDLGSKQGTLRYGIKSGNTEGKFSINPSTGAIVVAGSLDREATGSYALTVTAADMLAGDADSKTVETTFTVTINDKNDNYPEINPSSYITNVNENAAIGANIIQLTATDDDAGIAGTTGLQYSITAGNTGNVFTTSGAWITLAGNLDANTRSLYTLTVKVADQGSPVRSASTLVTIAVVSINEHNPIFTSTLDVSISESTAVGSSIDQIAASDDDTGVFGVLRYYLILAVEGNMGDFSVDLFDGTVRVANALDYDTTPNVYKLHIEVEDTKTSTSNTNTATQTYTISLIDENDQTPTFTQNTYSYSLDENVANPTAVRTVTATDSDSGANGNVVYSIVSGSGRSYFTIDSITGEISTAAGIDYESLISFDLIVEAKDSGTPSLSASCIVRISVNDLNDNAPVLQAANVAISIPEDTGIGTTVATLMATDDDSNHNNNNDITFSFESASGKFEIVDNSIRVKDTLDRETQASHTLKVLAVDGGTTPQRNTATATYTIVLSDINDNDPQVQGAPYDTSILEDTDVNFIVFTVTATDDDINENAVLEYAITAGNTNNDFVMDSGSGIIQVKNELDRERTDVYYLEVTITDNGATPRSAIQTATVTVIDVNDNPPVFQPAPITTYQFSVAENVNAGSSVGKVSASDLDTNNNAQIQYSIAYFIRGNSSHFRLDAGSGDVDVARALDREKQDLYVIVIRARDSPPSGDYLTATATVSITILDVNDNVPSFSQNLYFANVVENDPVGTSILTIVFDDIDIDINDDISLSIADTIADYYIAANESSFYLYVKNPIDREAIEFLNFNLTATDAGVPPLSFTTQIQITVGDVNDNAPIFSPVFYNSEIAYNDKCQVTVAVLTATDADQGLNAEFSFSTTLNDNPHLFALNSATGAVTMIATATADTKYKVFAQATDFGNPALTSVTGATIRIDTYDPAAVIVNFLVDISEAVFLGMEGTFFSQLTTVYQQTYSTSQAKKWCITVRDTEQITVHVYVVKDDTSDELSEINNVKRFLTVDEAFDIAAYDSSGVPATAIKGSAWTVFNIQKIEKYVPDEEVSTPWIKTNDGIIAISFIVGIIIILAITIPFLVFYKIRNPSPRRNRVQVTDDDDRMPAKNQFASKNNTLHTFYQQKMFNPQPDDSMFKGYDKSHPTPAVISLPMPSATKRVPTQINNRNETEPVKDINLWLGNDNIGPTLLKKPEKLRSDSPIPTEPENYPPRRLPPVRKHPAPNQRGPKSEVSPMESFQDSINESGPNMPRDNTNYLVMNREFDGRAIDPVSGRLYEYNTRTNERRWVNTPDGQQVKLTRDDN
ncbi:protocadherin Fat 4-like isoform X2 [Mya arenaria]|uniref:protocadherin Fat 4-like isoform X2 n=1 Tax=Mya arenaria TaxID=6604 RepID=UPI0022E24247|nr:protocadherin Fat 4-like isoform X2 [Mya arenaria]